MASVEQLVLELADPATRENALLDLSKKREAFPELAPYLWHSFGTIAALLQEVVSIYPLLSPPALTAHASNRVCNALALLQCVASHPDTRALFLQGEKNRGGMRRHGRVSGSTFSDSVPRVGGRPPCPRVVQQGPRASPCERGAWRAWRGARVRVPREERPDAHTHTHTKKLRHPHPRRAPQPRHPLPRVSGPPSPASRPSTAHVPLFLYPFLNTVSKTRPFEYLRLTSLGVVGALVKVDDPDVIAFLLSTEVIPLCLRTMEMGSELSKTVATFIVQKILLDGVGLAYICATAERFFAVSAVLASMVGALPDAPSVRLLKHVIRCYLRLSDNARAREALRQCLPALLADPAFTGAALGDDLQTRGWLAQLLANLGRPHADPAFAGVSEPTPLQ